MSPFGNFSDMEIIELHFRFGWLAEVELVGLTRTSGDRPTH
jgi:hypothetical protein